jgi:hypothetical protein
MNLHFCRQKTMHPNVWTKQCDLDSIAYMVKDIKNPVLKQRVSDCLKWTLSKAWRYLRLHITLTVLTITLNGSIPIIVAISNCAKPYGVFITVISSLAGILTTITQTTKTKELWQTYRCNAELIKKECMLFSSTHSQQDESKLSESVERIMEQVYSSWPSLFGRL